jgi:hypothetical protein
VFTGKRHFQGAVEKGMSGLEMYQRFADERHEGLKVDENTWGGNRIAGGLYMPGRFKGHRLSIQFS